MNFRKMQELGQYNGEKGQTIKVVEHIILQNLWEIYVIESENEEENAALEEGELFTLTVGMATEMGYQYESEIEPYILSRTKNLHEVLPAPNWKWVGES